MIVKFNNIYFVIRELLLFFFFVILYNVILKIFNKETIKILSLVLDIFTSSNNLFVYIACMMDGWYVFNFNIGNSTFLGF